MKRKGDQRKGGTNRKRKTKQSKGYGGEKKVLFKTTKSAQYKKPKRRGTPKFTCFHPAKLNISSPSPPPFPKYWSSSQHKKGRFLEA